MKIFKEKGELKEYSGQDAVWIKTVNCTPYTIIFDIPSDANEKEYKIINAKGKHVGTLKNSQGSNDFLFFFFVSSIYIFFKEFF